MHSRGPGGICRLRAAPGASPGIANRSITPVPALKTALTQYQGTSEANTERPNSMKTPASFHMAGEAIINGAVAVGFPR
jgi:hypothetical protein